MIATMTALFASEGPLSHSLRISWTDAASRSLQTCLAQGLGTPDQGGALVTLLLGFATIKVRLAQPTA